MKPSLFASQWLLLFPRVILEAYLSAILFRYLSFGNYLAYLRELLINERNDIAIGCVSLPEGFDLIFNVPLHLTPNMIPHDNLIMLYLSCDLFLRGLLL
jgi:hypothetical protein